MGTALVGDSGGGSSYMPTAIVDANAEVEKQGKNPLESYHAVVSKTISAADFYAATNNTIGGHEGILFDAEGNEVTDPELAVAVDVAAKQGEMRPVVNKEPHSITTLS